MEMALQWVTAVAALVGAVAVGFVAQQLWFGAWTKAQWRNRGRRNRGRSSHFHILIAKLV
jgi:hypothetical protein